MSTDDFASRETRAGAFGPGNQRVARLLYELGVLSERLDDRSRRFRARAYRRAADAVAALDADVLTLPDEALAAVPGIGSGTVARIDEIRRTGTIARLEQLRAIDPGGAEELLRVPGLGPRTVARLRDTLGIRDVSGLRAALDAGQVRTVRGLGPISEQRLRQALAALDLDAGPPSLPLVNAVPLATRAAAAVRRLDGVAAVHWAGALRRLCETVDAIGLVALAAAPERVVAAASRQPWVRDVVPCPCQMTPETTLPRRTPGRRCELSTGRQSSSPSAPARRSARSLPTRPARPRTGTGCNDWPPHARCG